MNFKKLGKTDVDVSTVCLGTMTWGRQNTEAEGHEQMDYAVSKGINFFDTAEIYSIPVHAETYGATEEIIGTWFKKRGKRDDIVLATKMGGIGVPWIRDGDPQTGQAVTETIDNSLKRLQTDYIDLYQLHWPNRPFPHFGRNPAGKIDFSAESTAEIEENLLDILTALGKAVQEGKIRYCGLSNETAWGIMKFIELAEKHDLPRIVSIQNEFSLLNRSDDPYVAETCAREDVSYLPWSPLARGMISGKYRNGARPEGSRWAVEMIVKKGNFKEFRDTPQTHGAIDAYIALAQKHDWDVCQMALAFCQQQNFVTATIIGATTMEQLKSNIDAFDMTLSDEILEDIDRLYREYPLPF